MLRGSNKRSNTFREGGILLVIQYTIRAKVHHANSFGSGDYDNNLQHISEVSQHYLRSNKHGQLIW
jgi:hypothetical protein